MGARHGTSDARDVVGQFCHRPFARLDGWQKKDVHYSWPCVEAEPRVDCRRNSYVEGNDRRLEIHCEVERPFVEAADLACRHAAALGTEVHRFSGPPQHSCCPLKDLHALMRTILWHGEERAEHPADDAEGNQLSQESAQEEPAVRQTKCDEHEKV